MEAGQKTVNPVLKYGLLIVLGSVVVALVTLAMPIAIRAFVMEAFKIPSATMVPTLLPGDHILVDKSTQASKNPSRGDIVVFKYPKDEHKNFVKRIVGIAGDVVELRGKKLYINSNLVSENYAAYTAEGPERNFGPVTVPENAVFVMGDNRDNSQDSRVFGAVEKGKVIGKVRTIYWSWDRENDRARWDRIGKTVQ